MLVKIFVHVERVPEEMRLVSPSLLQALEFCHLEVVIQNVPVVRMRTFLDDDSGTFSRRQSTNVSQSLCGRLA